MVPRKFDLLQRKVNAVLSYNARNIRKQSDFYCIRQAKDVLNVDFQLNPSIYLSFPMYVLLDLDMLSASIDMIYSVHVVLLVLFADKRNFPFSTSNAAGKQYLYEEMSQNYC